MAYLRADIMWRCVYKNSNRRNDVPLSPSSFVTFDFAGLSSNLAYITSVFIGYIGTDSIGSLIKRFAAKKPEQKTKSIINVRRSSICWRGRRELITDVRKPENHGYDVIVGGELFNGLLRSPRKLVTLNPKLNQQERRRYQLLSVGGCLPQAAWPERLLRAKSGRCGIAAD